MTFIPLFGRDLGDLNVTHAVPYQPGFTGDGLTLTIDVECDGDHSRVASDVSADGIKYLAASANLDRREIADLHDLLGEWLDQYGRP